MPTAYGPRLRPPAALIGVENVVTEAWGRSLFVHHGPRKRPDAIFSILEVYACNQTDPNAALFAVHPGQLFNVRTAESDVVTPFPLVETEGHNLTSRPHLCECGGFSMREMALC